MTNEFNKSYYLQKAMKDIDSKKPVTPYMNHYLVEAMIKLGKNKEAMDYVKSFWGVMVKEGADTFYEVFVPGNPLLSPYGDSLMNSKCHAWSCTPSYFIRKMMGGNGKYEQTQIYDSQTYFFSFCVVCS
ncbi:MAG: hypothetical protein IJW79_00610 [Clostridia bacterium]|nr:hypothetical protein [Clostridia bacterium]